MFEPRLKFETRLKIFKFGLWLPSTINFKCLNSSGLSEMQDKGWTTSSLTLSYQVNYFKFNFIVSSELLQVQLYRTYATVRNQKTLEKVDGESVSLKSPIKMRHSNCAV